MICLEFLFAPEGSNNTELGLCCGVLRKCRMVYIVSLLYFPLVVVQSKLQDNWPTNCWCKSSSIELEYGNDQDICLVICHPSSLVIQVLLTGWKTGDYDDLA
jgi:hypothetical protein